jgi:hypothetical protein
MWTKRTVTVGVGLVLLTGCGRSEPASTERSGASAEMAIEVPRVAPSTSINAVMVGLVDHAAHGIWDLGRAGMAPETNREWEEVQHAAIQLIAAGSYITFGGTGQMDANWVEQTSWRGYAQDLSNEGMLALDAAIRQDLTGVLAAGDSLIVTCEACHAEYKPALPTEGIAHPH